MLNIRRNRVNIKLVKLLSRISSNKGRASDKRRTFSHSDQNKHRPLISAVTQNTALIGSLTIM